MVLYRKYEVSEIVDVTPRVSAFDIAVHHIKLEYCKLLTSESVFWAEGGTRVQINGSGLTVQASPLIGSQITLHNTFDASKLSEAMSISYICINIGQVESLSLSRDNNQVVSPEISPAGVNHLETLLHPYVNADPGKGAPARNFELQESTITDTDSRYLNELTIYVDAAEAGSLSIGTPVLFRDVEVGTVTGTRWAKRILCCAACQYQPLRRQQRRPDPFRRTRFRRNGLTPCCLKRPVRAKG